MGSGAAWLFWLAALLGAAIAGVSYSRITGEHLTAQIEGETRAGA